MPSVVVALQAIVLERPVFVREQSDGLYRVITYLTFKVLEEVVLAVASSVVFSLLVYYLVRLQGSFFPVWIVFLVTQLVGVGELSHLMTGLILCSSSSSSSSSSFSSSSFSSSSSSSSSSSCFVVFFFLQLTCNQKWYPGSCHESVTGFLGLPVCSVADEA